MTAPSGPLSAAGTPGRPDEAVIVCDRVCCRYGPRTRGSGTDDPAGVRAVTEVSVRVAADARVALTGPSGSGKSTLLHLMAGLVEPTGGRLDWPGLDWPGLDRRPGELPGAVGVVFQGPSLLPDLTAEQNVSLPLLFAGRVTEHEVARRARAALDEIGAGDLAKKWPDELSGGQAQRVAIARVLASRPRVILADEPTGALDRAAGAQVVSALLAAADELGAALVIATHDPTVAERMSRRWPMRDGRLVAGAPTDTGTPHPDTADISDQGRPARSPNEAST